MSKIWAAMRLTTTTAIALALVATITNLSGCGREERGPILSGGREVKSWIADLHKPKPQVRRQAVLKLGNTGDSDPATAEGLAEALQDSDALVRRDAIRAVAKLKQPGALIKERLETMSQIDEDSIVRDLASKALARLGGTE
ncbi:MAG: HEAT repeat domain-containing protein [Isosphaeraceae bacterium]